MTNESNSRLMASNSSSTLNKSRANLYLKQLAHWLHYFTQAQNSDTVSCT